MKPFTSMRDPVYDYIDLTPIEMFVVGQPVFQRLRFVTQNSTAHFTYPANLNSRFLHSLGVMHLSGNMFIHSIKNASPEDLRDFLHDAKLILDRSESELSVDNRKCMTEWKEGLGNASGFNHQWFDVKLTSEENLWIVNTLWQSIRLCALIHDIGHLPLSHLFEEALYAFKKSSAPDNLVNNEYSKRLLRFRERLSQERKVELGKLPLRIAEAAPIHEVIGLMIMEGLQTKVEGDFAKLTMKLAQLIFLTNTKPVSTQPVKEFDTLRCMHMIVAGELDADRLDYCVRDPMSSGLELGAIDVKRIVESMVLFKESTGPRGHRKFSIFPQAKVLSAIEAFFHQRYQVYKNLVYHHNVMRMNGIAREIIVRLFQERSDPSGNDMIIDELDRFGFWFREARSEVTHLVASDTEGYHILSDRFCRYEDAWLRSLMSSIFVKLDSELQKARHGDASACLPGRLHPLWVLLDTYLYRRSPNMVSLWKRDCDCLKTMRDLRFPRNAGYGPMSIGPFQVDFNEQVIEVLRKQLSKNGVILIHQFMPPKVFKEYGADFRLVLDGKLERISDLSPYLSSLLTASTLTPNVHLSFVGEGLRTRKVRGEEKPLEVWCRELAFQAIRRYALRVRGSARVAARSRLKKNGTVRKPLRRRNVSRGAD